MSLRPVALVFIGMLFLCQPRPLAAQSPASAGPPRLPGAQAVIDAAQFSSLQEALDAVPSTGGLVTLPPGTFEIHEPQ